MIKLKDLLTEAWKPSEVRYQLVRYLATEFEIVGLSSRGWERKMTINGVQTDTQFSSAGGVNLYLNPKGAKEKRAAKEVIQKSKKWFKGKGFKNDPVKTRLYGTSNIWMSPEGKLGVQFKKSNPWITIMKGSLLQ
jgi:hypothetical protein